MREIFVIVKKELRRFFTDKRMLMSLILPGLLIFVLYSLMGTFIGKAFTPSDEYEYVICVENESETLDAYMQAAGYKYKTVTASGAEAEQLLADKEIDLFISFSDGFDGAGENKNVIIKYNSAKAESAKLYSVLQAVYLQNAIENIDYRYTVNAGVEKADLATEQDISKMMMTMFVPFILLIFLVTGSIGVATESIAGEKERGTIATLLVTPVKREYIALGKIIALTITSLFSSLVSFVGLMGSLPKLLQTGGEFAVDISVYGAGAIFGILGIILVSVMMFTMVMSILSTFAKSVKEASQLVMPAMIIVMLAGVTSMIGGGKVATNPALYLIPVYNCAQSLAMIFSGEFYGLCYLLTILSDLAIVVIGVIILAKMFNNEKIMLNK